MKGLQSCIKAMPSHMIFTTFNPPPWSLVTCHTQHPSVHKFKQSLPGHYSGPNQCVPLGHFPIGCSHNDITWVKWGNGNRMPDFFYSAWRSLRPTFTNMYKITPNMLEKDQNWSANNVIFRAPFTGTLRPICIYRTRVEIIL